MKTGSSVKVYVSVLMLEVDHVTLVLRSERIMTTNKWLLNSLFSKESTCNEVVSVLLSQYRYRYRYRYILGLYRAG